MTLSWISVLSVELDLPMLPDAADVALVTHGDIGIIAAQEHLVALGDDVAVADTGVDGGLCAAVADSLDLLDGICHLHEPQGAGEELGLEVGTQAEAHNRYIKIVHDGTELIDLCNGKELALIHNDGITGSLFLGAIDLVQIQFRGDHLGLGLQANTALYHMLAVTGICARFHEPDAHVVFLVIILGDQCLGRLAGAHRTVFKVKLCHLGEPLFSLSGFIIPKNLPICKCIYIIEPRGYGFCRNPGDVYLDTIETLVDFAEFAAVLACTATTQ